MPSPKKKPIKWTIQQASIEFGTSPPTLGKALAQASIAPAADGTYSTQEICQALFGLMHQEKLATQKEIREKLQLENQITRGQMLSRSELAKALALIADAMTSRIAASELSRSAKEDLLKDLSSIPLMLRDVAHAQSRLPRRNGLHPEEAACES
jgi:hypothetical protein